MSQTNHPARTVSVVVPCLNEERHIERLLDAVRLQDRAPDEVIVVDCGSQDDTIRILQHNQERFPAVPLVLIVRPGATIPIALNTGISSAKGEVIVRLDAHSSPSRSYLGQLLNALIETRAGVVGGVWSIAPGADTSSALAIRRAVSHPLGAGDAAYRISPRASERMTVDTVPYGCYHRSTWEKLGGYNEELQANEDYEFNYRVRLSGLPVILDPAIRCTYFARPTLTQLAAQYFRYGWWKAQMLKRYPQSIRLRQAIPVSFVATLIVLACAAFFHRIGQLGLAALAGFYGLVICSVSIQLGRKVRDWKMSLILPLAFATIHCCWGIGMLTNLLSFGFWQRMKSDREER